jgi:hypothetical protein
MYNIDSQEIIKNFKLQSKIKRVITIGCYFIIISGIILYISNIFQKKTNIKIVNKLNNNKNIQAEKIMEKPQLTIKSDNEKIYKISAQKAYHINNEEVTLIDVLVSSEASNISAGELNISDSGDRLTFSKNPVLIFKQ